MNILFIGDTDLRGANRGTPLRVYNFLRQINKKHTLTVCAKGINLDCEFVPYPKGSKVSRLRFFVDLIRHRKIDVVFTATEVSIFLPVVLKAVTGVGIAIDLHGLYGEELYLKGSLGVVGKALYDLRTKFFLSFFDLVFAVSGKLSHYYRHVNKNRVVIYGGAESLPEPLTPRTDASFVVGYSGNARGYQGLEYLLDAVTTLNKTHKAHARLNLVLSVGSEAISQELEERGLAPYADVRFNLPHEETEALMRQSDVLVIPRPSIPVTEYAFPSKLTEALASGVVTITTDVGPVSELLAGKDFCIIIPSDNIARDLAQALAQTMEMDQGARRAMGKRAQHFVQEELGWDKLGRTINRELSKLHE